MVLLISLLIILGGIPATSSEEIPIVVNILNAAPELVDLSISIMGSEYGSVDPGMQFSVNVTARDNNTVADIDEIDLVLYSPFSTEWGNPDPANHYAFRWRAGNGFTNPGGTGEIFGGISSEPSSLASGMGSWIFSVKMDKSAIHSDQWTLSARISDDEDEGSGTGEFTVNKYSSLYIDTSEISFSGVPGSTSPADQNPISIRYSSNYELDLACWATDFVGRERPEVTIGPASFIVDDDDSLEPPEQGANSLELSGSRKTFLGGRSPAQDSGMNVHLFIRIPDSFYDQEYDGHIFFDLR